MVGHNGDCLGKVQTGTSAEGSMYSDHRGDENNSNKSVGNALESANSRNVGLQHWWTHMAYKAKSEKPRKRIYRIWAKADKVDSKFSMVKDHVTLSRVLF